LDLPDELLRQVKARAALEGATLKETLTRYIQNGLRQPTRLAEPRPRRSALPVLPKRAKRIIPSLTPEMQAELEEKADFAKHHRSVGR
jgi:hypothetical protein